MSLNGVCICHRLCCVIPEVLKTKQNENLFTHNCYYILKERKKNPAAYNMRITDSMCIHSQTVLLMYHLLRTT